MPEVPVCPIVCHARRNCPPSQFCVPEVPVCPVVCPAPRNCPSAQFCMPEVLACPVVCPARRNCPSAQFCVPEVLACPVVCHARRNCRPAQFCVPEVLACPRLVAGLALAGCGDAHAQVIREEPWAFEREEAFGVELHAFHWCRVRGRFPAEAHDFAACRPC